MIEAAPPNPNSLLPHHSCTLVNWAMCTPVHHLYLSCHPLHRPMTNHVAGAGAVVVVVVVLVLPIAVPIAVVLHRRVVAFAAFSCTCHDPCLSTENRLHHQHIVVVIVVGVEVVCIVVVGVVDCLMIAIPQ